MDGISAVDYSNWNYVDYNDELREGMSMQEDPSNNKSNWHLFSASNEAPYTNGGFINNLRPSGMQTTDKEGAMQANEKMEIYANQNNLVYSHRDEAEPPTTAKTLYPSGNNETQYTHPYIQGSIESNCTKEWWNVTLLPTSLHNNALYVMVSRESYNANLNRNIMRQPNL